MSALPKSVGAMTLFVVDPQASKAFYQAVFAAQVLFEDDTSAALKFDNLILNFITLRSAGELIDPATVGNRASGARFQLTVWVEDTDAVCAQLAARGVGLINGPVDRDWGMRTACFADPDGHIWEVAQRLT